MNIEITPKKSDGLERLIEVRVPIETIRDAENRAAQRYATSARLPGFRPGKAPPAMIKKRFKDAIRQQVIESLVQEAYQEVVDREKLKVASQPHVHDLKFEDGQPLSFELHVEIRPEVALARTQGFRVTRTKANVTDDAVREQIEQLREQKATWSPVEGRPAPGDMVRVELSTADENGEFPEPREYPLVLGAGQAIAGVEELIMQITTGETVEKPVRWPEDFPDEAQRGKTKPVRLHVLDVKRKTLPPLDDAFARDVGDFDSLDGARDHGAQGSRGPCESRRRRRRAAAARRPDLGGESVRRAAELGLAADRRIRAGVSGPRGRARQVPRRVPADRRASGAARPDHRHDRRDARVSRRASRTSTNASPTSRPSAARTPGRCTRRCRRPAASARSSRVLRKTKCSPGSWNETTVDHETFTTDIASWPRSIPRT